MSNLKENIKAAQIDLIKDLGIEQLDQEQKEEILTQIGEILQQRIVLRIVEELPEEKQDEFQAVLEKAQDDPDQLDKYLEENIPGVEDMILAEIGEYKKGASDFMKKTLKNAGAEEAQGAEPVVAEAPEEKMKEETKEVVKEVEAVEFLEKKPEIENELVEAKEALIEKVEPEVSEEPKLELKPESEVEPELEVMTPTEPITPEASVEPELELKSESVIPEVSEELIEEKAKVEDSVETIEPENLVVNNEIKAESKIETEAEEEFRIGDKPIQKVEGLSANNSASPTGIEQEQADQEAQILEENKVENTQVAGEELDLSNEIEKMTSDKDELQK
jgi:pilus assembly protein FimV